VSILDDDQIASWSHESNGSAMVSPLQIMQRVRDEAIGADRYLIAVAGPPGAGKSKFSYDLMRRLSPDGAIVIPMDGFHYDNAILDQHGLRARKGAPETFDYRGFKTLLRRIRQRETEVAFPVFDREADLARAGAALIDQATKFIIVEGNYLLLNEDPWSRLAACFDFKIFLDVPKVELERRLLERWKSLGYSQEAAQTRAATNDMRNVDRVLSARTIADLSLSWSSQENVTCSYGGTKR